MDKNKLYEICNLAKNYYKEQLHTSQDYLAGKARNYLNNRNINTNDAKKFELGYAPVKSDLINKLQDWGYTYQDMLDANVILKDQETGKYRDRFINRIMFPIYDNNLQNCGFSGRTLNKDNPAKYINTAKTPIFDKSDILYGMPQAIPGIGEKGSVIIVEGQTDVIAMHKAGFTNCVATLGTALTNKHIYNLNKMDIDRVIYMFDGDEAGQKAAQRSSKYIREMHETPTWYYSVSLPEGLDPAEFIDKYGASGMQQHLNTAKDLIINCMDNVYKDYDLSVIGQSSRAAIEALHYLIPIRETNPEICNIYCDYLCDKTNNMLHREIYKPEMFVKELYSFKAPKTYNSFNKQNIKDSIKPSKQTTKSTPCKDAR